MSSSVICDVCKRQIGNNAGLSAHMRSMHTDEWRRQNEANATPARGARPLAAPTVPPPSASNGIRWEEPPETRGTGRKATIIQQMVPIVVELKRNPGRSARLRDYKSKSGAHSALKLHRGAFPDIQFTARSIDGGSALFARYVEEA